ncbi:MAG: hypothetical protein M0Z92_07550 [Actinomycetota bacterium]|nr:hypothetical protein [Actinomycetota bacterium]
MLRSGRIHRTIVSIAVALSMVLAVVLAKLHPGITSSSTTNSGSTSSQSAGSGSLTSPNSATFGSGSTGAVSQPPIMASGGS